MGRLSLWVASGVAATIGILCAVFAPEAMKSTRFGDYAAQVESLQAGRWFFGPNGEVLHRYPPLYALVLWGLGIISSVTGLELFGVMAGFAIICHALTAGIVWGIGRALGLKPWAAAVGALAFCLHPFGLYGMLIPLSETPFMVLFSGGILVLMRVVRQNSGHGSLCGGLLIGLACLFRPIAVLAPLAVGTVFAAKSVWPVRVRLLVAARITGGFLAVILPWVVWVRVQSGDWVLVSSGGPPTLRDGLSFNHKPFREELNLPVGVARVSDAAWKEYDKLDSVRAYVSFIMRLAAEDPWAVAQTYFYKAARAWYGTDGQKRAVERFNLVASALFLSLTGLGAWRLARLSWPDEGWLLVAGVVLFWLMATVTLSIARYTTPAIPLLAPFAGFVTKRAENDMRRFPQDGTLGGGQPASPQ